MTKTAKKSKLTIGLLFLFVVLIIGIGYWRYRDSHPSTDDAYIKAHIVNIAPQVSGRVLTIAIKDNQSVKKGQLLFRIDPKPFQIALARAKADLTHAREAVHQLSDSVKAAQAAVAGAEAEYIMAKKNAKRILTLANSGRASKQAGDDAKEKLDAAKAALIQAKYQASAENASLGKTGNANAQVRIATAALHQAELNLQYTKIVAPADGHISNFTLRPGTIVNANQQLFGLIERSEWWAAANFKETKLGDIKVGDKATVIADMYPDHPFTGHVQSISPASGAIFSLLPPENASGNWVKVTQRFPVRVEIDRTDKKFPLRAGASCTVTINAG